MLFKIDSFLKRVQQIDQVISAAALSRTFHQIKP